VATTEQPYAVVGDFALLRVKAVNKVGAFLDWGLVAKDLLVPFSEQRVDMKVGRSYIVRVYLDEASHRIVASAKLAKFLNHTEPDYYHRERVEVLVVQRSDMGYRVIVEGAHWGQIYQNETYQDVNVGDRLTAFVKQVRPDGKVDLTLSKIEKMRVDDLSDRILDYLKANNCEMTLTDKASPDDINKVFQCSKKDFKKALVLLYKQQKVTLGDTVKLI
jgi:predicted RNA-binding protein (virulence factor B family)